MRMKREREEIVEAGRLMYQRGLCQLCGGNLSIRDPETGLVAIKPSGGAYIHMKPEDIIIVDLDGNIVEGEKKPSIETQMHLRIYRARPEMRAVVHSHPVHAVAWSLQHTVLPSVIVAQYLLRGAVADGAVRAIGQDGCACILQAHGVIAASPDDVFHALEMNMVVEDACRIAQLCEASGGGDYFTIDQQLGNSGGYDGLERLRRLSGK